VKFVQLLSNLAKGTLGPLAQLGAGVECGARGSPRTPDGGDGVIRESHDFGRKGGNFSLKLANVELKSIVGGNRGRLTGTPFQNLQPNIKGRHLSVEFPRSFINHPE
jgi:hypothetical protein